MPDQRTKKKKLRASDFVALLKIDKFNGKFQVAGVAVAEPAGGVEVRPQSVPQSGGSRRRAEPEKVKPDPSFKIKDSLQKIGFAEPARKIETITEKGVQLEARDAFNEQLVVSALEAYMCKHTPETIISIALKSHRPEIQGENICIPVDNQLQIDKLEALKLNLQNNLAQSLNNGFVSLSFKLFDNSDGKEKEKLFTSGQKFEHFLKLNPVVAELKMIFGLELE